MSEVLLKERMETIAVRKKERALKRQVPGSADQHCLASSDLAGMRSFAKAGRCARPGVQAQ